MDTTTTARFTMVCARLGLKGLLPSEDALWDALRTLLPDHPALGHRGFLGSGAVSIYAANRKTDAEIIFPDAPDIFRALLAALETVADQRTADEAANMWAPRIVGAPQIVWFTLYDTQGGDSYEIGVKTTWSDGSVRELHLALDAHGDLEGRSHRLPFRLQRHWKGWPFRQLDRWVQYERLCAAINAAVAVWRPIPGRPPFMHPLTALSFTPQEREVLHRWACKELHVVIKASDFTPQNPLQRAVTYYAPGCEPASREQ
jgi:hypothetical protein